MNANVPDSHILTPQMLRDRAKVLLSKAAAMDKDAQWTDSSQARIAIQDGARELRQRAAALGAEANTLEADLASPPKDPTHV